MSKVRTMEQGTKKILFKGIFNFHGEVYTLYRYASSKAQAFSCFTNAIAYRRHLTPYSVRNYFLAHGDSWRINPEPPKPSSKFGTERKSK